MKFTGFDMQWWLVLAAPVVSLIVIHTLLVTVARFGLSKDSGNIEPQWVQTPAVYGLAVLLVYVAVVLVTGGLPGHSWSLLTAMGCVVAMGFASDVVEIDFNYRVFAQLVAALIVASGTTVHVTNFGDLFGSGEIALGKWWFLVTVLSAVGLMNAIRLTDMLDGLAGSLVIVPLMILAGVAIFAGEWRMGFEMAVLIGTIAGIFLFNLSPRGEVNSQRLGSASSVLIGLLLFWYSAQLAGTERSPINPITAVLILSVPLLDMASHMILHIVQRKSPLYADRQHWYLFLVEAGYSGGQVVTLVSLASLALGLIALQAERSGAPESMMLFLFLCLLGANLLAMFHPQRFVHLAVRIWAPENEHKASKSL